MARTGVSEFDVEQARKQLLAKGQPVTIAGLRRALGDTGSLSTIQKHLKVIEERLGGAVAEPASVSETLLATVQDLASQLQGEADARITAITEQKDAEITAIQGQMDDLMAHIKKLEVQLADTEGQLDLEKVEHHAVVDSLKEASAQLLTQGEQLTAAADKAATLKALVVKADDAAARARTDYEAFRQQELDKWDAERAKHREQLAMLENQVKRSEETLVLKNDELIVLNRDNAQHLAEKEALRQSLAQVERQQLAAQGTVEQLRTALQQSQGETQQVQLALEVATVRAGAHKADYERIDTLWTQEKTTLAESQAALTTQQIDNAALRQEIKDLTARNQELQQAIITLKAEKGDRDAD